MHAYAKAIYAAVIGFAVAFLSALLPYLQDGGFGQVTAEGWVTAAIAGLVSLGVAGGAVYAVPNRTRQDASSSSTFRAPSSP